MLKNRENKIVAAEKSKASPKNAEKEKDVLPGGVMLFSGELIMIWCLMISYLSNTVNQSNAPQ